MGLHAVSLTAITHASLYLEKLALSNVVWVQKEFSMIKRELEILHYKMKFSHVLMTQLF